LGDIYKRLFEHRMADAVLYRLKSFAGQPT